MFRMGVYYNEKSIRVEVETVSIMDQIRKTRFQRKHTTRCGGGGVVVVMDIDRVVGLHAASTIRSRKPKWNHILKIPEL